MLQDVISLDRRHRIVPVQDQSDMVLFVPLDLPRHVEMRELLPQVERLTFRLGRLSGQLEQLPDAAALHRLLSHWDAVLASGSLDRTKDLLSLLVSLHMGEALAPRPILNCAALYDHLLLDATPCATADDIEALLQTMHRILTQKIAVHGHTGAYRLRLLGSAGFLTEDGRIGPPPPDRIAECIRAIAAFIVAPSPLPFPIQVALIWGQFLAIAPFSMGNETIVHSMIVSLIRWHGYPTIFLSEAVIKHSRALHEALQGAILRGDWQNWCRAVLDVLDDAVLITERHIDRIMQLPILWKQRLDALGLSTHASAYAVLSVISTNPIIDIGWIGKALSISYPSAKNVVSKLLDAGISRTYVNIRKKRVLFVPDLISLFDEGPHGLKKPPILGFGDILASTVLTRDPDNAGSDVEHSDAALIHGMSNQTPGAPDSVH